MCRPVLTIYYIIPNSRCAPNDERRHNGRFFSACFLLRYLLHICDNGGRIQRGWLATVVLLAFGAW